MTNGYSVIYIIILKVFFFKKLLFKELVKSNELLNLDDVG